MTKEELIAKMANSAGITKVAATVALEAFTGAVTTSLKKGKRVTLVNFGTFTISKRKARMGRNPRTGEALKDSCRPHSEIFGRQRTQGRRQVIARLLPSDAVCFLRLFSNEPQGKARRLVSFP